MKNLFLLFLSLINSFATTAEDLGLTENDFNFLSGLTGLLTSVLIVFIIYKKV